MTVQPLVNILSSTAECIARAWMVAVCRADWIISLLADGVILSTCDFSWVSGRRAHLLWFSVAIATKSLLPAGAILALRAALLSPRLPKSNNHE